MLTFYMRKREQKKHDQGKHLTNDLPKHIKTDVELSKLQSPVTHTNMRRILVFLKEGYLFEWVTESTGILHVKVSFSFPVPLCKLIIVSVREI